MNTVRAKTETSEGVSPGRAINVMCTLTEDENRRRPGKYDFYPDSSSKFGESQV